MSIRTTQDTNPKPRMDDSEQMNPNHHKLVAKDPERERITGAAYVEDKAKLDAAVETAGKQKVESEYQPHQHHHPQQHHRHHQHPQHPHPTRREFMLIVGGKSRLKRGEALKACVEFMRDTTTSVTSTPLPQLLPTLTPNLTLTTSSAGDQHSFAKVNEGETRCHRKQGMINQSNPRS